MRICRDVPDALAIGLFGDKGKEYPVWARFSSDTLPASPDYLTTVSVALTLFGTPTPKIFGAQDDTIFDIMFRNMEVKYKLEPAAPMQDSPVKCTFMVRTLIYSKAMRLVAVTVPRFKITAPQVNGFPLIIFKFAINILF